MIDIAVHAWFQAHRVPWITQLMLAVSWLHDTWGLLAIAVLFCLVLWRRGDRAWCWLVVVGVSGAMLLNVALKHLVQRARPVVDHPLVVIDTFSFPSGHAAGTTALYACAIAWLLARQPLTAPHTRLAVGAGVTLVLWVSGSRVYLGVHWLSDVLAGMAFSLLWVLACLVVLRSPLRR